MHSGTARSRLQASACASTRHSGDQQHQRKCQQQQQQQHQQQLQQKAQRDRPYSVQIPRKAYDVVTQDVQRMTLAPCASDKQPTIVSPLLKEQMLTRARHWLQQPLTGAAKPAFTPPNELQQPPVAGQAGNLLRLPRSTAASGGQQTAPVANVHLATGPQQHHYTSQRRAWTAAASYSPHNGFHCSVHKHPPIAPQDPCELLKVLQVMDPPRRRIVIFKGGGYIYAEMEAMLQAAGLGHVMRLTNLMRKAHCIVARERRDNGKHVNLSEHLAAARNANIPFLLIDRIEPQLLVALLRPLLLRKRIVTEHPQSAKVHRTSAAVTNVDPN